MMVKKSIKKRKNNNGKNGKDESFNGLRVYSVDAEKRKRTKIIILKVALVIVIIIALAALFALIKIYAPAIFGKASTKGELAAKVNDYPITMAELNSEYSRLPTQYQYSISKEMFLSQMIDEFLLMGEASKQGLVVSDKEVNDSVSAFMSTNNLTREALDDLLSKKNLDYKGLKNLVKSQLLIDKLVNVEVKSKVNVPTEMSLKYYNDNPELFKVPEMADVKHILISIDNMTDQEAAAKAGEVFGMIKKDKSNFCELVAEYTTDTGSADQCGEYIFTKGQMDADFEKKAFEQDINGLGIVKTMYGYHIIWTVNKTPDQLMLFSEVQDQINSVIEKQQEKSLYSDLMLKLRGQATIVNYLEQKNNSTENNTVEEQPVTAETEQPSSSSSSQTQTTVTITQPSQDNNTQTEPSAINAAEEEIIAEQKNLSQAVEETPVLEEVKVEEPKADLASCLASKGAKLYGAYWDASTKKQKESLQNINLIEYVECGVKGDYKAQQQICSDANIQAYPTWVINGENYMGVYSSQELAAIAGC